MSHSRSQGVRSSRIRSDLALVLLGMLIGGCTAIVVMRIPPIVRPAVSGRATVTGRELPAIDRQDPSRAPGGATPNTSPLLASLRIPSIGVIAKVEVVGLTDKDQIDVPKNVNDVGWYENSVAPGLPGDAVIDGHLDWYTGPAVFWRLPRLTPGAVIEVNYRDGAVVKFQVYSMLTVAYDQPPAGLLAESGAPRLSLITCAGSWDGSQYSKRLVVEAAALD
jgi:sortase (surface protein transpeptidase)